MRVYARLNAGVKARLVCERETRERDMYIQLAIEREKEDTVLEVDDKVEVGLNWRWR